ncbi:IS1595 family transposase [Gymnodinialimonas sp. 57CJ19]|uniref:IS1595 family transposase n=1 Tax=Gymnodinialimonas sp. 57CJ19 TaxID=3138498 RepID=UPI00313449F1
MNLTDPIFTDKDAARAYMEAQRWADGVFCPHCGGTDKCKRLEGAKHRPGLFQCGDCRKQFTVTVGTVFERSKVALNKWMLATHLMASSKKGFSAHQLHRSIGVTYKTAWFMWHRIREAMTDNTNSDFGAGGGVVEVDETFIGREPGKPVRRGVGHKMKVLTLVDRSTGRAKSVVVDDLKIKTLMPILEAHIAKEAIIHTDTAIQYDNLDQHFSKHESVNHGADEYVRGDVTTNTVEGYFSIFKRGMKGVYQHCDKQHLHRYAAEFAFRYSNRTANGIDDTARAALIIKGAEGKRLTYRRTNSVFV